MSPGDIHDIRGPISIPSVWPAVAVGAAALAAMILAYFVVRFLRRRARERTRSPAEIALERIERARATFSTRESAAFCDEVSNALRAYVEARFALAASHRTTEELLRDLVDGDASVIAAHGEAIEVFLRWCDLAKFARLSISADFAATLADAARRVVDTTAIEPSSERAAPAAARSAEAGA